MGRGRISCHGDLVMANRKQEWAEVAQGELLLHLQEMGLQPRR